SLLFRRKVKNKTDTTRGTHDPAPRLYQEVYRVVCDLPRPLLLLGPLMVMRASLQTMERGVSQCRFIDYRRGTHDYDVLETSALTDTAQRGLHCVLDTAPSVVERLHRAHIYPIVVFLRYKSHKHIRLKLCKEQFECGTRTENEFSRFFTAVLHGAPVSVLCSQIDDLVAEEQRKVLWIPASAS
ncbi:unnamed protein product, partial [Lampetra fluviatilis]